MKTDDIGLVWPVLEVRLIRSATNTIDGGDAFSASLIRLKALFMNLLT